MPTYTIPATYSAAIGYEPSFVHAVGGQLPDYAQILSGNVERGVWIRGTTLRDVVEIGYKPDVMPIAGTLRNLRTAEEFDIPVTLRPGSATAFEFAADVDCTLEGDTFEFSLPVSVGARHLVLRRTYVVLWPLEGTDNRIAAILDMMEADTYVIPEEQGHVLYFVKKGTGDWQSGEILLKQDLYDMLGMMITDASTFVARAVSKTS